MTDLTIRNGAINLAASVHGPEGAPDVVFLHGISQSRDTWEETVARLKDRYRCWTLDFRGHGHSDRAESYLINDYVSDAAALLDMIGRSAIVIGHSLGGAVGAVLAQGPHRFIKAALLEDPPYYLAEPKEWARGIYGAVFTAARERASALLAADSTFPQFVEAVRNAPAVQGGKQGDHHAPRHIGSLASGMMRHDIESWAPVLSLDVFAAIDVTAPMRVPVTIIQADHHIAPAFMAGHEKRFIETSPDAKIIYFEGAPHRIHATKSCEARCLDIIEAFVETAAT
ncbi:MAG: alpha/beta hydrolase [Parvularculaceae bacterium]